MKTPLLQSRKFWTLMIDTVISLVSLVVSLQFSAQTQKVTLIVIGILQPMFLFVVAAYTVDDTQAARVAEAQIWADAEVKMCAEGKKVEDCCHCD